MKIALVDLQRQHAQLREEIDRAMEAVIRESAFIGNLNNPYVRRFEEEYASWLGIGHCVACGNGTDALEILIRSTGIGPGDEVIVPSLSWIATSEAVSNMGAVPVFVDITPDSYCIDATAIEARISPTTRAIIPVHLYGHPADMDSIMAIARKHDLIVIEDCAQAHGARLGDRVCGTIGHAAAFSFFPGKNLGAMGDAGAMVTRDPEIARRARMIAQHGQSGEKHRHLIEGRNSRMDGLQAAVLSVKLPHLDRWTELRQGHAQRYGQLLTDLPVIRPVESKGRRHVYHLYVIRTPSRDQLQNYLASRGIATTLQYPKGLPFLDAYAHLAHREEEFPAVTECAREVISIPMFPEMHPGELEYVAESIHAFFRQNR